MKRAVSISFLLFANIFMLAHTVIPHHHHNGVALFESQHSDHDHGDHQHRSNSTSEQCLLSQACTRFGDNLKIVSAQDLLFIPFDIICKLSADELGLAFWQKPHIALYHSLYLSSSIEPRGPPVC